MPTFTPGQPVPPTNPLALHEPKLLGPLISSAIKLWWGQPSVFFITAALVVIPFEVIVLGVLGGGFNDPDATASLWAEITSFLFMQTLGTALVTATHSRSVVALSRGESLTTEQAFRLGTSGFGAVLLAGIVYALATLVGFLVIVPGIFLMVAGVFTAQIAALERVGPIDALKRSIALVRAAGWWRTWGYLIVIGLISAAFGAFLGLFAGLLTAVGDERWFGSVFIVLLAIIEAAALSFTALVTTLLYFSWRAQTEVAPEPAEGPPTL